MCRDGHRATGELKEGIITEARNYHLSPPGAGRVVQVGQRHGTVEVWAGDECIAVHPRARRPGQRFILPGQWSGLPVGDKRPGGDDGGADPRG